MKKKETKIARTPMLLVWNFPADLRRKFKIRCAELNVPMNRRLITLCQNDVKHTT